MCLDCGCHQPLNQHGDARHITYPDLQDAAVASGITPQQAAENIAATTHEIHLTPAPAEAFSARAARPVLISDIDGVLAFLTETITTALNAHFGTNVVVSQMHNYWIEQDLPSAQRAWLEHQFQRGVFYENCAPDYAAIAALGAMHLDGYHVIVSSDRPAHTRPETDRWLAEWRVPHDEVVINGPGSKKALVAAHGPEHPAVLFDDDPSKATTIARPGVEVWSPQRPWTPKDWKRYPNYWVFPDWDSVLERLGVHAEVSVPQLTHTAGPAYTPHGGAPRSHEGAA